MLAILTMIISRTLPNLLSLQDVGKAATRKKIQFMKFSFDANWPQDTARCLRNNARVYRSWIRRGDKIIVDVIWCFEKKKSASQVIFVGLEPRNFNSDLIVEFDS